MSLMEEKLGDVATYRAFLVNRIVSEKPTKGGSAESDTCRYVSRIHRA